MSWGYMFYAPTRLPLAPAELSEETVRNFTDLASVRARLTAALPHLAWATDPGSRLARGTVTDGGEDYELSVTRYEPEPRHGVAAASPGEPPLLVTVRCSGRIDSAPFAQRLCDATGWIAFDDRAYLFQPHQPPVPGGGG